MVTAPMTCGRNVPMSPQAPASSEARRGGGGGGGPGRDCGSGEVIGSPGHSAIACQSSLMAARVAFTSAFDIEPGHFLAEIAVNDRVTQRQETSQLACLFEGQAPHSLQNFQHLTWLFAALCFRGSDRPRNGFQSRPKQDQCRPIVTGCAQCLRFIDLIFDLRPRHHGRKLIDVEFIAVDNAQFPIWMLPQPLAEGFELALRCRAAPKLDLYDNLLLRADGDGVRAKTLKRRRQRLTVRIFDEQIALRFILRSQQLQQASFAVSITVTALLRHATGRREDTASAFRIDRRCEARARVLEGEYAAGLELLDPVRARPERSPRTRSGSNRVWV